MIVALLASAIGQASILPIVRLEPETVQAFETRVDGYESDGAAEFRDSGKLWIDRQSSRRQDLDGGKIVADIVSHGSVPGGHVYYLVGAVHVPGATIETVERRMQDYSNYSNIYKPDVAQSHGELLPDSTPGQPHYRLNLRLVQSTLWIYAGFDTVFDTHYVKPDPHRLQTHSRSISIKELRDGHNPDQGAWPEGNDHGFLWRIDTWWNARERNGGVDLELINMTLTRPVPAGFGWWASRKARQSVENLLKRTRAALEEAK